MSARRVAYPVSGSTARIPRSLWLAALETIRLYGRFYSEGLVYFAGVVGSPTDLVVTSLYRLHHRPQGHRVEVTPEESRRLVRLLRERDEKLVAQLHSHGGPAFHSGGDDAYATSFHPGFLSIVVPHFGEGVTEVVQCGVFEFVDGMFQELNATQVAARVALFDEIVEFAPAPEPPAKDSWWTRFVRKLKLTAANGR